MLIEEVAVGEMLLKLTSNHSSSTGQPLTAFYESTLRESLLSGIKVRLKDKFNIMLQPATGDGQGPVLDIRDGTKDDMFKLQEKSKALGKQDCCVTRRVVHTTQS